MRPSPDFWHGLGKDCHRCGRNHRSYHYIIPWYIFAEPHVSSHCSRRFAASQGREHPPRSGAPRNATLLCALVACVLATFFDVEKLSKLLDMGILLSYSVVSSAVLILRAEGATEVEIQMRASQPSRYQCEGGEVGADDPLLPSGRAHANRTFESRVHNENRRRVMLACVALVLAPLFPGFAIANKWSWPSSSVLVVYSIVSGGICFFGLACRLGS